ncbi:MAG: hypothetical protein JNM69_25165 [Archangium sp.]|nr:hypothetical protein [Archangium sp.]
MRGLLVVTVLMMAAGCNVGVQAGGCDPGSCVGCCNSSGQCVSGIEPGACGSAGSACSNCTLSGLTCQLGQCVQSFAAGGGAAGTGGGAARAGGAAGGGFVTAGGASGACGPSTCPGCCANGVCQLGVFDAECGTNGNVCGACVDRCSAFPKAVDGGSLGGRCLSGTAGGAAGGGSAGGGSVVCTVGCDAGVGARPVIISATATPSALFDGGVITLTIVATSQSPVNWLNASFGGPAGNIWGGGSGVTFTEVSPGTWRYSRSETIDPFAPSGTYSFTNLSVENQAQLTSAVWPNPVTVSVTNTRTSGPPVITSVTATPSALFDGGVITLTVVATSQAPVNWFNGSFSGPNGNIWGGGSGVTFTEISPGTWRYSRTETINPFAPSGTYSFTNLSVENQAQLTSAVWPNPVTVSVTNTRTSGPPVITSVTATPSALFDGGVITLTVVATSQAPVNWFNGSFSGPSGNIWGGGSGVTFTEISPGTWRYSRTETISNFAPSGTYSYTNLSVENQAQLRSSVWPNAVNVSVTNR